MIFPPDMTLALIDAAHDRDSETTEVIGTALFDLGKKKPLLVLSSCHSYLKKHSKVKICRLFFGLFLSPDLSFFLSLFFSLTFSFSSSLSNNINTIYLNPLKYLGLFFHFNSKKHSMVYVNMIFGSEGPLTFTDIRYWYPPFIIPGSFKTQTFQRRKKCIPLFIIRGSFKTQTFQRRKNCRPRLLSIAGRQQ